jgi:flagellum-specific peptidoglycan hydrolase FlgJ
VTVTTGGVITGLNFVPGTATTMTSPASVPMHLLALEQGAQPGTLSDLAVGGDSSTRVTSDAQLRAAIVNVAGYYLRLAKTRTPAQMEALIWDKTSSDGADHGESCAAFASLALELAAQAVGQQSWVSGGETYPWPMPDWADVRVDTNPDSPQITSLVADAQQHDRWHPLGDGYQPQAGDWVVYDGHVEVVTSYANGVLDSIGADSLPGLTVNAHSSAAPLADQGVVGFVNNGNLAQASGKTAAPATSSAPATSAPKNSASPKKSASPQEPGGTSAGAAIPGVLGTDDLLGASASGHQGSAAAGGDAADRGTGGGTGGGAGARIPGLPTTTPASHAGSVAGSVAIPGVMPAPSSTGSPAAHATTTPAPKPSAAPSAQPSQAKSPVSPAPSAAGQYSTPGTKNQQAFISLVAPGAVAAQQRYGVPAAVTIAQAIEESAWGQSGLAAQYHNLFGIKGTGPAGSVSLPTSEFQGGQWVTVHAPFRVYHNDAESIADHAELLATSGYYTRAMADRGVPDAFANDLTGVYATDPDYGANLIALMKLYNLYQYDGAGTSAAPAGPTAAPSHASAAAPAATATPTPTPTATPTPTPTATASPAPTVSPTVQPTTSPSAHAATTGRAAVPGVPAPGISPAATAAAPAPAMTGTNAATGGHIPGRVTPGRAAPRAAAAAAPRRGTAQVPGVATGSGIVTTGLITTGLNTTGRVTRTAATKKPARYHAQLPHAVTTALFANAKAPLARGEHLYRDVAACTGVGWELLAAVDWMQCKADPRYSPVHGEKIGSLNDDGTAYPTKSAALIQCASDLVELAAAVYGIDLTVRRRLSVRELAAAFAAFRWGALLRRHNVSPMEFPYSVAGLTAAHQKMHWPSIDAPDAPDRPGGRFRAPFGAVPVVLSLDYPATV